MPIPGVTLFRVPVAIPAEMELAIASLRDSRDKMECLVRAYQLLSQKYRGYRIRTYVYILSALRSDLREIWQRSGFLHCMTLNYLLKILLVKSGYFRDADVRFCWTLIWFISPHQYIKVRIADDSWVDVDLWGRAFGIPFGSHAHGIHSGSLWAKS